MMMLIPSVISICLLKYLERYNIRYSKISVIELKKNRIRDGICGIGSALILLSLLAVFAVIFVVPLVQEWPYKTGFTLEHIRSVLADQSLLGVYKNSLLVAGGTAVLGLSLIHILTVIVITHNSAITPMADRVIKIKNGKVSSVTVNDHPVPVETIEW